MDTKENDMSQSKEVVIRRAIDESRLLEFIYNKDQSVREVEVYDY